MVSSMCSSDMPNWRIRSLMPSSSSGAADGVPSSSMFRGVSFRLLPSCSTFSERGSWAALVSMFMTARAGWRWLCAAGRNWMIRTRVSARRRHVAFDVSAAGGSDGPGDHRGKSHRPMCWMVMNEGASVDRFAPSPEMQTIESHN